MLEYFLYAGVISDRSSFLLESDVDARVCDFIELEQVIEDIANFGFGLYFTDLKSIAEDYAKNLSKINAKITLNGKEVLMVVPIGLILLEVLMQQMQV